MNAKYLTRAFSNIFHVPCILSIGFVQYAYAESGFWILLDFDGAAIADHRAYNDHFYSFSFSRCVVPAVSDYKFLCSFASFVCFRSLICCIVYENII